MLEVDKESHVHKHTHTYTQDRTFFLVARSMILPGVPTMMCGTSAFKHAKSRFKATPSSVVQCGVAGTYVRTLKNR